MKLNFLYILCYLFIGYAFMTSCTDEEEGGIRGFEIAESDLVQNFTQDKTFVMIPVTTSLPSSEWSIRSGASWCRAVQSYDNSTKVILLEVDQNGEPEVRTTTLEVESSIQNYTITVNQLGCGKAILVKKVDTLPVEGGSVKIEVTANVDYEVTYTDDCDWLIPAVETRGMVDKVHAFTVPMNDSYESRSVDVMFTCTTDAEVQAVCVVAQKGKFSGTDDVAGDIQVQPSGVIANQEASDCPAKNCIDNKFDTHFHSPYAGATKLPVELEFTFDDTPDIDYLIYTPRGGNGDFGELDIFVMTQGQSDYQLLGSFDFGKKNVPSRVNFSTPLKKVTKVMVSVKSGKSSNANAYVSCAEMQFFKRDNSLEAQLQTVFTDVTCSELRPDVTKEMIDALPGYFANVGFLLKNNTYDEWEKKFRIHDYEPYSDVEVWASNLMTKKYSNLDNPTGIYANAGESLIVLVGDTHGQTVSLQAIPDRESKGDVYPLVTGVNKIAIKQTGMLFLMYTADLSNSKARPIRVHIPPQCGHVDGFYDLKEDKTDEEYVKLLSKANYKYFCVRGEKIIFYFHTTSYRQIMPNSVLPTINLWDNVISWEQELMGIDDVRPSQVNNHIFAISLDADDDGYMWASDYRIAFKYTTLDRLLDYNKVMASKGNVWGPAHEVGHIHQSAINWPICTEASNNLFSNFVMHKLGEPCSRGKELSLLATQHCVNNDSWVDVDNELKMRLYWQLWNYFHRCEYMPDFWQKMFKELRTNRLTAANPGLAQMQFVKAVCKVANMNLTDFFETWGFFTPINREIEQYGNYRYTVTTTMIGETKAAIKDYPAPAHAIQYIEDRRQSDVGSNNYKVGDIGHYSAFKDNRKITKKVTYSKVGNTIMIQNGEEAVAFELKRGDNVLYFSNFFNFDLPESITLGETEHIFAVQADGTRIEATAK
ncbi:M60 family metallopeptidase [uncultured Bacteroides sp.]|uniref:M60 family metallopeptidase n=1 Tax=uncultured Bacteroides sp. TaxID=162156 RepID=UPI00280BB0A7|nr:M60 family metallopeptidase [uncultured Bacteroides sp.]